MAESLIALRVEPRVAEVGRRLCISWSSDDVTVGHWIGLFPSGNKLSRSRVNVVRTTFVVICHFNYEQFVNTLSLHGALPSCPLQGNFLTM